MGSAATEADAVVRRLSAAVSGQDHDKMVKERCQAMREALIAKEASVEGYLDDSDLTPFLYFVKFDTDKACALYAKHFQFKLEHFKSYLPIRQEEVRPILEAGPFHTRADLLTREGQRVVIMRPRFFNWKKMDTTLFMKGYWYIYDAITRDPVVCERGIVTVISCKGVGLSNVNMTAMQLMSEAAGSRLPVHINRSILMDEPWFFDKAWSVVSLFLIEPLRKQMEVVGSKYERLHGSVDPSLLPPELGGSGPELDPKAMMDYLASHAH